MCGEGRGGGDTRHIFSIPVTAWLSQALKKRKEAFPNQTVSRKSGGHCIFRTFHEHADHKLAFKPKPRVFRVYYYTKGTTPALPEPKLEQGNKIRSVQRAVNRAVFLLPSPLYPRNQFLLQVGRCPGGAQVCSRVGRPRRVHSITSFPICRPESEPLEVSKELILKRLQDA